MAYWHQPTFSATTDSTATVPAYARLRPMGPGGNYDPEHGIPEIIVGTGGEALDTLAVSNWVYANPNVVTAYDQGYGVMNLTLKPNGYSFTYKPVLAGAGFGPSALGYSDSGSGKCSG